MNPITQTKEFQELNEEFKNRFGDNLPSMELPADETLEGLKEKIQQCYDQNKDILYELYGIKALLDSGCLI